MFSPQEGWTTGLSETKFVDLGQKISHRQNVVNQHFHPNNQQRQKKVLLMAYREFGGCWSEFPMRRQRSMELLRDMESKAVIEVSSHRGEGFSDSHCFTDSVQIQCDQHIWPCFIWSHLNNWWIQTRVSIPTEKVGTSYRTLGGTANKWQSPSSLAHGNVSRHPLLKCTYSWKSSWTKNHGSLSWDFRMESS